MVNIIIYFSGGKDKQKSEYDQENAAFIVFWKFGFFRYNVYLCSVKLIKRTTMRKMLLLAAAAFMAIASDFPRWWCLSGVLHDSLQLPD